MSGIATAIGGTALLGMYSSNKAAGAASDAAASSASATLASTEKNIEFQKWLWGEQTELQQPYMDMGEGAIPQYQDLLNQPIDITQDPSYQFRLNEGQKAYENSASAKGMSLSGAQAKALNRYGSNFASQEYGAAFNRRQTSLDNLYRMIAGGQSAASMTAQTGTSMGNQVSGAINTGGQALSNMYTNQGNISAASAMAPYNTLTDMAGLAAMTYGGEGWGA